MTKSTTWDFADGWILMSIYAAGQAGRATLEQVIATADAMNHAIPTFAELSTSLGRLTAAQVVEIANEEFMIAAAVAPEIERAYAGRGGLFASPEKGRRWLNRARGTPPEVISTAVLSESHYSTCCDRYARK